MRRIGAMAVAAMGLALGVPGIGVAQEELAERPGMAFTSRTLCAEGSCQTVLVGEGSIRADTPARFLDAFEAKHRSGDTPAAVVLQSPGGDLAGALRLGAAFRTLGVDTQVVSKGTCASACAYAFLGGRGRRLAEDAFFGVHRFSAKGTDPGSDTSQQMVNLLTTYITGMGVSSDLVRVAAQAEPTAMRRVDLPLARALKVDNAFREPAAWSITTQHDHLDLVLQAFSVGNDREALVNLRRVDKKILAAVVFQEPGFYSTPMTQAETAGPPRLSLCRVGRGSAPACIPGVLVLPWKEQPEGRYGALFEVDRGDLEKMARGEDTDRIVVLALPAQGDRPIVAVMSSAQGFRTAWRAAAAAD